MDRNPELQEQEQEQEQQEQPRIKQRILKFFNKKNLTILCSGIIVFLAIFNSFKYFHKRYELKRDYLLIVEALKIKGDIALKNQEYVRAMSCYDRILYFGERVSLSGRYKNILKEVKNTVSTSRALKRVQQGYVFYDGKWIKKEKALNLYFRTQKIRAEIRNLLREAILAFAKANYDRAVELYESVLRKLMNIPFHNTVGINTDEIRESLKRALLYSKVSKADKLLKSGKYFNAAILYEEGFRIANDIGASTLQPMEDIQRKVVRMLLKAYRNELQAENFDNARIAISKAKKLLNEFSFLPAEELAALKREVNKKCSKLEIAIVSKMVEKARNYSLAANYDEALKLLKQALVLLKNSKVIKDDDKTRLKNEVSKNILLVEKQKLRRLKETVQALIDARRYEDAREVMLDELNHLGDSIYPDSSITTELIKMVKKEISYIEQAEKADAIAREKTFRAISRILDLAVSNKSNNQFDRARKLVEKALIIGKKCKFSDDKEIQELMKRAEELMVDIERSNAIYRARKTFNLLEKAVKSGDLIRASELCDELAQRSHYNPWHDNKLDQYFRKAQFVKRIVDNAENYFATATVMSARKFFEAFAKGRIEISVDNPEIKKFRILNGGINKSCLNISMNGLIGLYVKKSDRMAFYPVECKTLVRVCENGENPVYQGARCRELKKKCTLCPQPIVFGNLRQ